MKKADSRLWGGTALGLWFAVLAAGIIAVGWIHYRRYEASFRSEADRRLSSIADLKVSELTQWRQGRWRDGNLLFKNPVFADSVRRFLAATGDRSARNEIETWLGKFFKDGPYDRVRLLDAQGVPRLTVPETEQPVSPDAVRIALADERSGQVTFHDFYRYETDHRVYLSIVVPIFDETAANRPLGAIMLRVDPEHYLYPYINRWPTPSQTGETLLVRRDGDDAVFLNELRFRKDTALTLRIPAGNSKSVEAMAVDGTFGMVEGSDYRGVPSAACIRAVPNSPWFLVAKMDTEEVYAPLRERLNDTILLVAAMLAASGAGVGLLWRHRRARFYLERFRAAEALRGLFDEAPVPYHEIDANGIVRRVNRAECALLGFAPGEIVGRPVWEFVAPDIRTESRETVLQKLKGQKSLAPYRRRLIRRDGAMVWVETSEALVRNEAGEIDGIRTAMLDITERMRTEEEREATVQMLELINSEHNLHDLMESVVLLLRDLSGCEAVGIRLKMGGDFPYFETRGFPAQFVQAESSLCQFDDTGKPVRDATGNPALDCMCGNVLCRRFDPSKPFFTANGAFWTNSTTDLLAGTNEADRQARTRNRCNGEGYESVALVPLRMAGDTIGLVQLNDKRRGRFTAERIGFFERMADNLAVAIAHRVANERIRRDEHKFRSYIDNAPLGVFVADGRGRFVEVNRAAVQMLGHSSEELAGLRIEDILAPEDRERGAAHVAAVAEKGAAESELQLRRKDGTAVCSSVRAVKLGEDRFIAFVRDITDSKRVEAELRESEEKFAKAFRESPVAMAIAELETYRYIDMNNRCLAMMGCTWKEVIGRTPVELGWISENGFREPERKFRAAGRLVDHELELRRSDGIAIACSYNAQIVPVGGKLRILSVTVEITERKKAEERVREQAALLDVSSDAVLLESLDRTITYWNKGAEAIYGWTAAEALGRDFTQLLFRPDSSDSSNGWDQLLEKGAFSGERRHVTKDGREIIVHVRSRMMQDKAGCPKQALVVMTDVTEARRLEEQYLRAQRLENLGSLASSIAHDLNNVLTPIMMSAEMLKPLARTGKHRDTFDVLVDSAQRGADIVKQLLLFGRGGDMTRKEVNVATVLEGIRKMVRETFPRNLELSMPAPKDLWRILGDRTQIFQVILNLCMNARDAMPHGGRLGVAAENVRVDEYFAQQNPGATTGPHVAIQVADTGTGIAPAILEKIFDPFFTTKSEGQGTGLGLSTVLGIVRHHGGFINVQSREGGGSEFRVFLPAGGPAESEPGQGGADPGALDGQGRMVLVIEDEESLRQILELSLRGHGYRPLVAANGAEAIALFAQRLSRVQMVVTDVMMPVMDGLQLIQGVRRLRKDIPIIVISGLHSYRAQIERLEDPHTYFLAKPFLFDQLLAAMHQAWKPAPGAKPPEHAGHSG
jgi:PAS domain S-box-containing protein